MNNYSVFFDKDNATYRLPTNPEQIETSSVQAIQKYEILKLGQIAIPTHLELKEYGFECELPYTPRHYVETSGNFRDADYYLNLFQEWRDQKATVRFIASNGISDDINTLVLIEELTTIEKAGEEGDKYIGLQLLEYREFGKKAIIVPTPRSTRTATVAKREQPVPPVSPKSSGYHVVQSGDSLWAVAKKYYGDGNQYNKIVNVNKDKIKNPSLIYPGQKLVIPV